jgi:polar amino acid transport system substrate-binding protein
MSVTSVDEASGGGSTALLWHRPNLFCAAPYIDSASENLMKRPSDAVISATVLLLALVSLGLPSRAADFRVMDIVQAGGLRTALFLPQYAKDPTTSELHGQGTGLVGIQIARLLASRLNVKAELVGYPTPADVTASLKSGTDAIAFMGIEPSRVAELDFSPPVIQFDYTFLVSAGSLIDDAADADQAGVRIAYVSHHAASLALVRVVKRAELVGADLPEIAFDLLRTGKVDALALARPMLVDYLPRLPGSHILRDAYGVNRLGIAMKQGHAGRLDYVSGFVEEAKASGLVQHAIEQSGLREIQVSPPGPAPAE